MSQISDLFLAIRKDWDVSNITPGFISNVMTVTGSIW